MNHTSLPTQNCKTKVTLRIQLQYNCLGNSYTYITTVVQLKYNYMPTTLTVKQSENNYRTCHRGVPVAKRALINLEEEENGRCWDLKCHFILLKLRLLFIGSKQVKHTKVLLLSIHWKFQDSKISFFRISLSIL
jgi:hypothetical protein